MEKIHKIEFTTKGDKEELKKRICSCVENAYLDDKIEESECDRFIISISELTKLTYVMNSKQKAMLDRWTEHMLGSDRGSKLSFRASYAKPFSEIGSDIIELAKDFRDIENPDRKEAKINPYIHLSGAYTVTNQSNYLLLAMLSSAYSSYING